MAAAGAEEHARHEDDWSDEDQAPPGWDDDEGEGKKRKDRKYSRVQVVSGWGHAEGGPRLALHKSKPVIEVSFDPDSKKRPTRPKESDKLLSGYGLLTGGPRGGAAFDQLGAPPTGLAPGGPCARSFPDVVLQVLSRGAPQGLQPAGPSGYSGRSHWRQSVFRALEAPKPLWGGSPGGPRKPKLVFGVPLEELLVREQRRIPYIITRCFEYLSANEYRACRTVGIFRLSGATSDVERLVEAFDWGRPNVNLSALTSDPIAVAALVKLFLRNMPESLVPPALNSSFISLVDHRTLTIETAAAALKQLTRPAMDLYMELNCFLNTVATMVETNKMGTPNLAICVGPNTLRIPGMSPLEEVAFAGRIAELSQFLIDYALYIAEVLEAEGFGPYGRCFDGSAYGQGLTPEEIAAAAAAAAAAESTDGPAITIEGDGEVPAHAMPVAPGRLTMVWEDDDEFAAAIAAAAAAESADAETEASTGGGGGGASADAAHLSEEDASDGHVDYEVYDGGDGSEGPPPPPPGPPPADALRPGDE